MKARRLLTARMSAAQSINTQQALQKQTAAVTVEHAALSYITSDDVITHVKKKYLFPWWDSSDPYVVFDKQIRERVLLIPFSRLRAAAELVLGRDVHAAEFLEPSRLLEEWEKLKARAG